jgi:soluble lytic murein transglycosylase
LALDKRNVSLARYLLKRYKKPRLMDHQLLVMIQQNPAQIVQLKPGELHDHFYLYGLKRLVSVNMNQALKIWDRTETRKMLPLPLQQSFIAHVVLYKAMRGNDDADIWFAKVKPAFYSDVLLEWKIRLALKRQQWQDVEKLINHYQDKENLCWQYWLARAKEETGKTEEAHAIYQSVAANRHYYGFLASMRLHKNFSFQNESIAINKRILKSWQPFTDNIRQLYNNKQTLQASRLLNDFLLELPLEDKSALISWVDNELQWHAKSLYLSSNKELNNQLNLRFPLPFGNAVTAYSKNYQVPMELIYAIIRQESGFREDVVSSAGARGLMQVMPGTAKVVAKLEKIAFNDTNQLFLSQKNINIGVAYLRHLGKQFSKNFILMAAAYNAGPRQVNYWLKTHSPKEADIWIETLPWYETRNYLKNIISFYAVYQYRMQHKSDLNSIMQSL